MHPNDLALPGRDLLLAHLDGHRARSDQAALVLVDIDGFRALNEASGRAIGDLVLQEVGRRLRDAAHEDDLVASMGGDELVVVCEHGVDDARRLAERLRTAICAPLDAGGRRRLLTASIGVAAFDGRSSTLRNLLAAGAAVRLAKERGRDRVEVFDEGLRTVALSVLSRTTELRAAAGAGQLRLHFQPVVDLRTRAVVGCEGLLRWEHPVRGVLPPATFLDVAESSELLDDLTEDLVEQAASAAADLARRTPVAPPWVALNLAARQLASPDLVAQVAAALERHALGPDRLMVEITERTLLADLERAVQTLHGLKELGVVIALDDFGTGYSSLLHLRRLPVDVVKIDRSFVSAIMRDRSDLAIVAGVIDLALRLGLRTTAEGVEAEDQAATLRDLGCHNGQGFLWSPAVTLQELDVAAGGTGGGPADDDERLRAQILRLHADGASPHTVAAALNAAGARNDRGLRWHARSVARVLASAHHPGLRPGRG